MDSQLVRSMLNSLIVGLKDLVTHSTLPDLCKELGLANVPDGSKSERLSGALANVADVELRNVAEQFLHHRGNSIPPLERIALEDEVWPPGYAISKRCRREIAKALSIYQIVRDSQRFDSLLEKIFPIQRIQTEFDLYFGMSGIDLRQIKQHVYINPDDWSVEQLFEYLGAFDITDKRFALLLEGIASSEVQTDEARQRDFVGTVSPHLLEVGLCLAEVGQSDGYPVFSLVALVEGSRQVAKNLIFASSVKPDLRFKDTLDNHIEVVTNADKVLVYDRPLTPAGLSWQDLQDWWQEIQGIDAAIEAKRSLYKRLLVSLPSSSPPQRLFFKSYFGVFKDKIPVLPALIPEVWLHWDPQTVRQRGAHALLRSRMDFLMLIPGGIRTVIEIDGKQHYTTDNAPDTAKYAQMVAADRDLRLDGYEVFRFGGAEIREDKAKDLVATFFARLFKRYRIQY